MNRHNFLIALATFLTIMANAGSRRTIMVNGVEREYIIYKPASLLPQLTYPVVIDFHGGGGNASATEKSFGFDRIADLKKFIAVYPEGINKGWNDGRKSGKLQHTADDVLFVKELINK